MGRSITVTLAIFFILASSSDFCLARRVSRETFQRRLQEQKMQPILASFEVSPFTIFTERNLSPFLQRGLKRMIRDSIRTMGDHFGYRPSGAVELRLLAGKTYRSIDDPEIETRGFYANKKIRMRFDYGQDEKKLLAEFGEVFRHEYTHLVIASIDGGRTPRWLNEGLAVYEQRGREGRRRGEGKAFYKKMERKGTLVPIQKFVTTGLKQQYSQNARYFYEQSYILAKYLVDRYDFSKLRDLFKKMKEGFAFSQALELVYGLDLEGLAKGAYES